MNTISPEAVAAVSLISEEMAPISYGESYSYWILVRMKVPLPRYRLPRLSKVNKCGTKVNTNSKSQQSRDKGIIMKRFRAGLVVEAQQLLCDSTLGSRVIKKKNVQRKTQTPTILRVPKSKGFEVGV